MVSLLTGNLFDYNRSRIILCKLIYPGYITFYICCNCIPQDKERERGEIDGEWSWHHQWRGGGRGAV